MPLCEGRVTLNLHLVTTTNFKVWSFPKISSLHKMSSCEETTKEQISEQFVTSECLKNEFSFPYGD